MRSRDPGERFRDGLESGPNLWWGEVIDVLEAQDLEVEDPITGEPLSVNLVPPRSLVVQSLNGYGGAVAIPFIEPAGETSVPPVGSRVLVCSDSYGGHIVLGFYTPAYLSKQQSGEFGQMTPGERTIYGRGYRLRILDNYFNAADVRPSEAELDVDLIIGRRDQTIAPPALESYRDFVADRAWNSFRTMYWEYITQVLNEFFEQLGQDHIKLLKQRLDSFLTQVMQPQFKQAIYDSLDGDIRDSFLDMLKRFVSTGTFEMVQGEVITQGYNGYILPVIEDVLSRELAGQIHSWKDVLDDSTIQTLAKRFLDKNPVVANAYRNVYTGHIISYMSSKARSYILSKIDESLSEVEDIAAQQALRVLRNKWLREVTDSVKRWFATGLRLEMDHLVNARAAQMSRDILNKISQEINEGLIDPEALPAFELTVRSRRSGSTSFQQERKVRLQIMDDGSVEVSCDDAHRITLRADGTAILDVGDLLIAADDIQVTSNTIGTMVSGDQSERIEGSHEVSVDGDVLIHAGDKLVLDSGKVRLGEESGTRRVVLHNDSVLISETFRAWLNSHVHSAPNTPPTVSLVASTIGQVKSSAKKVEAK